MISKTDLGVYCVTLSWGSRATTRFGNEFNSSGIIGIGTPASREISGVRLSCEDDGVHLLRSERCLGLQNMLAPMLISRARTVVLKRYARMQCSAPIRRIGFDTNDTSAVCPDVPMTAAK